MISSNIQAGTTAQCSGGCDKCPSTCTTVNLQTQFSSFNGQITASFGFIGSQYSDPCYGYHKVVAISYQCV